MQMIDRDKFLNNGAIVLQHKPQTADYIQTYMDNNNITARVRWHLSRPVEEYNVIYEITDKQNGRWWLYVGSQGDLIEQ